MSAVPVIHVQAVVPAIAPAVPAATGAMECIRDQVGKNCVASVTRAINRIDGAAAKVSLKKGEAVVSYDREISDEELKKVVEDRGYHVVSIQ